MSAHAVRARHIMDDALRRAAESQMRRRAPDGDDAVDIDRASKRARETTTTASSPTETPALGRFAYGALRTLLDVSTFRGAVFATCARGRERSASKDLARAMTRAMGGGGATLEPVKMPGRGAVLLRASPKGRGMDAAATTREAMRAMREGEIPASRFLEKVYPIDGAFEAGDEEGTRAACARCVSGARRRSARAREERRCRSRWRIDVWTMGRRMREMGARTRRRWRTRRTVDES